MTNFAALRPDPTLELPITSPWLDEGAAEVNEHLSSFGSEYFIDRAERPAKYNGMQFNIAGGGDDRSREAAILMPGTFANGVWPHILARGEAISHMAAEAGLRDSVGNLVPVIMTGSPSMFSTFGLDKSERHEVRHGNYASIAERHLGLFRSLGYEAVAGVVASSQATALVAPFVEMAPEITETAQAVLAEPPHAARKRILPVGRQLVNFGREGAKFKGQLKAEGIDVIDEIFASGKAAPDFERGIIHEGRENWSIIRGFARGKLRRDLTTLVLHHITTTVVHGSDSNVARSRQVREAVGAAIGSVHDRNGTTWPRVNNLRELEVTDTNHSLMDRVGRFATIAAAGLTG